MGDGMQPTHIYVRLLNHVQICSTLEDWEHITERFKKATHYAEKALYKLLSSHIVPAVIEDMQVSYCIISQISSI